MSSRKISREGLTEFMVCDELGKRAFFVCEKRKHKCQQSGCVTNGTVGV